MSSKVDYIFDNYDLYDRNLKPYNKDDWKEVKLFGLFVTASWCPPCKEFENVLSNFYKQLNSKVERGKRFEVIHMASERRETEFVESIANLDWCFLWYNDKKIHEIAVDLDIKYMPMLFIFDEHGRMLSDEGRKDVTTLSWMDVWSKWKALYEEKNN